MKRWKIQYNQNGGEYIGTIYVTGMDILTLTNVSFMVDGVVIVLDEEILSIEVDEG